MLATNAALAFAQTDLGCKLGDAVLATATDVTQLQKDCEQLATKLGKNVNDITYGTVEDADDE